MAATCAHDQEFSFPLLQQHHIKPRHVRGPSAAIFQDTFSTLTNCLKPTLLSVTTCFVRKVYHDALIISILLSSFWSRGILYSLPSIHTPSMKTSITAQTIFAIATLSSGLTEAYRKPAHYRPPHVYYDYRAYHPSQNGSGHFESLNKSIIPWEALPPPLIDTDKLNAETNQCSNSDQKSDTFWLSKIAHQGTSPFLSDSADHVVYRNVKDFGAKGDGSTDDSAAFNAAITSMLTIVEKI